MSGECDKCGEYDLECVCEVVTIEKCLIVDVITNKDIEQELKKMPQFKTYRELENGRTSVTEPKLREIDERTSRF